MASRRTWPFIEKVWTDSAYRGERAGGATPIVVEVVTGTPNQKGFIVEERRWVVERTFSWIERNRRPLLNHEKLASSVMGYIVLAAAMVLVRRVATSGIIG
jgi:transposase